MIPYAVMMMNFIWPDGRSLEVRVLDPVEDGVSFRVSLSRKPQLEQKPDRIECRILQYETKAYQTIILREFDIRPQPESDEEPDPLPDTAYYRLMTSDTAFHQALQIMIREYSAYIHNRLELEEADLMEMMTGLKMPQYYPSDYDEWAAAQTAKLPPRVIFPSNIQTAISLDEPKVWTAFLEKNLADFQSWYWTYNHLDKTGFAGLNVTHIYIGNQFCPLLFPDNRILKQLLQKAEDLHLTPVIAFSTMPEYLREEYKKRILCLTEWQHLPLEIVVNDLGLAAMIHDQYPSAFTLTAGILLNKRKKDFRMPYLSDAKEQQEANRESTIDADWYRDYLKNRYAMETFSYEACGYPVQMKGQRNILHLPLYQMNTSGRCTLYALCKNGDRGQQEEIRTCPHYCQGHAVLYPDNLPVIGRWNSLFGFDSDCLKNNKEQLEHKNIQRIVIRM